MLHEGGTKVGKFPTFCKYEGSVLTKAMFAFGTQSALNLQQALMKLIGQNGIEDMVLPFAIDL
jgi:hypothetical protein